ncbi:pimeloyl-ACP methyl ester carboxylesterase [Geodermatophilus bullaregiensis]|uniref:alpha/beta fold hydrolase n=1 Tax=Geodermatophilus bullaregiensis TaxID=1564160 RepID=UPI00195AA94F|nr:alpha/beta hydrolase [Geodermatophilus bullaregiensis]MBM7805047.1 pimeloyl-ACP methyl ester carboxylesterase [Geodermatophilus bullaregiensis]
MADVVLVHGAWHGSWSWRRVVPLLWAAGHRVVTVTLTGLGERAHQLSPAVTLGTHVDDVVTAVRAEECRGAVLVGHSYGGVVVTGAADRLGEEVGALVYVDGVVPLPGESWSTRNPPEVQAARRAAIEDTGVLPAPPPAAFGLTGADADWVARRQTPQPGGVYDDPVSFDLERWLARPRTYVDCTSPALATVGPAKQLVGSQPGWEVVRLETGHDPMVSAPAELAGVLLRVAAR